MISMMIRNRWVAIFLAWMLGCLCSLAQSPHPYLVADFAEKDFETMLHLCHQGGFEYLLHRSPFLTYGHYRWNPDFASKGNRSVARMVQMAEAEGVHLGLYIQADAISVNDPYFSPKHYQELLRQGEVKLFDDIRADQPDIAIYKNVLLHQPSTLNLLLVGDELISYGTMEVSGDLMFLHQCKRGAYGTKPAEHHRNAHVYKLADSPERFVYPDGALRDSVQQQLTDRMMATGITFAEYSVNSGHELLNDMQRVQNVERWSQASELQDGSKLTLGWFPIRVAEQHQQSTTIEDLEWLLSKAAAFDAGYGILLGPNAVRRHGQMDKMLSLAKAWNELRSSGLLNNDQKEALRDPYQDWHLEQLAENHFMLYPLYVSRRYRCSLTQNEEGHCISEPLEWNVENGGRFGLRVYADGKGELENPRIHLPDGIVLFPCTLAAGQILWYDFGEIALVTDRDYHTIDTVMPEGDLTLPSGEFMVLIECERVNKKPCPEVSVRYLTRETPEYIASDQKQDVVPNK